MDGIASPENGQCIEERKGYPSHPPIEDGQQSPEIDGKTDQSPERTPIPLRKMLVGEDQHRFVKNDHIIDAALLGALPFVMDDARVRVIIILIPSLDQPVREIDVLPVHEKRGIEVTDLF